MHLLREAWRPESDSWPVGVRYLSKFRRRRASCPAADFDPHRKLIVHRSSGVNVLTPPKRGPGLRRGTLWRRSWRRPAGEGTARSAVAQSEAIIEIRKKLQPRESHWRCQTPKTCHDGCSRRPWHLPRWGRPAQASRSLLLGFPLSWRSSGIAILSCVAHLFAYPSTTGCVPAR